MEELRSNELSKGPFQQTGFIDLDSEPRTLWNGDTSIVEVEYRRVQGTVG